MNDEEEFRVWRHSSVPVECAGRRPLVCRAFGTERWDLVRTSLGSRSQTDEVPGYGLVLPESTPGQHPREPASALGAGSR